MNVDNTGGSASTPDVTDAVTKVTSHIAAGNRLLTHRQLVAPLDKVWLRDLQMMDELWECFSVLLSDEGCRVSWMSFPLPHISITRHATMSDGGANTFQAPGWKKGLDSSHAMQPCIRRLFDSVFVCLLKLSLFDSPAWCFVSSCVFFIHWSVEVSREGRVTPKINMLTKIPEKGEMFVFLPHFCSICDTGRSPDRANKTEMYSAADSKGLITCSLFHV